MGEWGLRLSLSLGKQVTECRITVSKYSLVSLKL